MRAREFVRVQPQGTLTIFDIDDTLMHTTAKIRVVRDGKTVKELTNQQFNNYRLQPGEEFDFGEFRDAEKFAQESTPIKPMIRELKAILAYTRGRVIMLTARADFDDRDTFIDTFQRLGIDMSRVHVHRAGNLPGNENPAYKKAVWVRRYLDTGKYRQVSLYDDSMTNLRVFKELAAEYPQVTFNAYYIGPKGAATEVEEDYHPNDTPPGPEFKPTMPKGTVRVDVSDVYDWYKLGQHISNLKGLGRHDFGQGPPSTIFSFGSEDEEHEYIKDLEKTGLTTTDIDPVDPNQPKGMKRQKTDPTYNVGENFADGRNPGRKGLSQRVGIPKGATIAQLEKLKNAEGERGRMARWQLNMRRGKNRAGSKN